MKFFLAGFLLLFFGAQPCFSQQERYQNNLPQHLAPQADFGWENFLFGDTTRFVNETIRGGLFKWYILNSDTDTVHVSASVDCAYRFDTGGVYTVCLQANNGHLSTTCRTIYVDSSNALTSSFGFMHCSNNFFNLSMAATACRWDFGDGSGSTDYMPWHEYADTGHYQVRLTTYQNGDSAVSTKKVWVDCPHFPRTDFTWRTNYDTLFVHWPDNIPNATLSWLFGDGQEAHDVKDTFVVFADTGRYDVVFIVLTNCLYSGSDQWIRMSWPKHLDQGGLNLFPVPAVTGSTLDLYLDCDSSRAARIVLTDVLGREVGG